MGVLSSEGADILLAYRNRVWWYVVVFVCGGPGWRRCEVRGIDAVGNIVSRIRGRERIVEVV